MEALLKNLTVNDLEKTSEKDENETVVSDEENKNAKLRLGLDDTVERNTEDLDLTEFEKIYKFLEGTNNNVIITGRAGTGKSSLLRYFSQHTSKEIAILAPTGVSAINVGGQTLHSFFKLKPRFLTLNDISNKLNVDLMKSLDTIIIDEISMVRADILDVIDGSLQSARDDYSPFGGIQMVFFGDLFQLPPVVTDNEKHLFQEWYGDTSGFFFNAEVMKHVNMYHIALEKIYRQKDKKFIDVLNSIRMGNMSFQEMQVLNTRVNPKGYEDEGTIIITTTNAIAKSINQQRLNELNTKSMTYYGDVNGKFDEKEMPTNKDLYLKEGAQIMMIKNDSQGRWVNGTVGKVKELLDDMIIVTIRGEDYEVKKDKWEKIKYNIVTKYSSHNRRDHKQVEPNVVATFTQFPIKLAWAITIHKCVYENEHVLIQNKGYVPIKNVSIGDMILSGNGEYHKCLDKVSTGTLPAFKITTKSGYTIIASKEHPLLIAESKANKIHHEYRKVEEILLQPDKKYLCINRSINLTTNITHISFQQKLTPYSKEIKIPNEMNGDIGYILGCLVGDGYYGEKNIDRIDITTCDNDVAHKVIDILKSFGLTPKIRSKKKNKAFTIYVNSKEFRRFLFSLGLKYVTKTKKEVPESILTSNSYVQSKFLQGLFDTDGSASGNVTVRYVGTSHKLIEQIQNMLLQFGIVSHQKKLQRKSNKHSQAYCLYIYNTSLNNFYTYVNFFIKKKQEALFQKVLKHVDKTNSDLIPFFKQQFQELYKQIKIHLGDTQGKKGMGITANRNKSISYLLRKVNAISYSNLFQVLDYLDKIGLSTKIKNDIETITKNNYFYDEIESIEEYDQLPMYDLEIENSHNFVVNGFICHNSQGATFDRVIIDFGKGAFAHGQTYVALSRCTTLEGIKLRRPITRRDVIVDKRVIEFMKEHNTAEILGD